VCGPVATVAPGTTRAAGEAFGRGQNKRTSASSVTCSRHTCWLSVDERAQSTTAIEREVIGQSSGLVGEAARGTAL